MADPRSILKNRKTKETYRVNSPTSLSKQNVFNQSKNGIDYSKYDQLIQIIVDQNYPEHSSSAIDRLNHAKNLRQYVNDHREEIDEILDNKKEFARIINQSLHDKNDPASLMSFLKILGQSVLSAKIPAIAVALNLVTAAAAQGDYVYHQGKPQDGLDMCKRLANCIQGYLTEIGNDFRNGTDPQIAQNIVQNATDGSLQHCLSNQDTLGSALVNSYRGPNESAANCSFTTNTDAGGKLLVRATNIDPITCDSLKESVGKVLDKCPIGTTTGPANLPSPDNAKTALYAALGTIGGLFVLGAIALGVKNYIEYRREVKREELNRNFVF